jgi:hypothetical protein
MDQVNPQATGDSPKGPHSNKKVLGYCLIVGLAVCTFGLDNAETGGFLAMQS